ncbi:MAG: hypothetical protein ACE5HX_04235 [bacterium]
MAKQKKEDKPKFIQQAFNPRRMAVSGRFFRSPRIRSGYTGAPAPSAMFEPVTDVEATTERAASIPAPITGTDKIEPEREPVVLTEAEKAVGEDYLKDLAGQRLKSAGLAGLTSAAVGKAVGAGLPQIAGAGLKSTLLAGFGLSPLAALGFASNIMGRAMFANEIEQAQKETGLPAETIMNVAKTAGVPIGIGARAISGVKRMLGYNPITVSEAAQLPGKPFQGEPGYAGEAVPSGGLGAGGTAAIGRGGVAGDVVGRDASILARGGMLATNYPFQPAEKLDTRKADFERAYERSLGGTTAQDLAESQGGFMGGAGGGSVGSAK